MMQKDKILHFAISAIIVVVTMTLFFIINCNFIVSALAGFCTSFSAGITKEYADNLNPNNKWDWKDLLADIIGVITGILLGGILFIL